MVVVVEVVVVVSAIVVVVSAMVVVSAEATVVVSLLEQVLEEHTLLQQLPPLHSPCLLV